MLHFALSSVDYKDEVKLLKCLAMIGSTRYAMLGNISYAMHGSTNSIARQVATVASRLRFDASSATCFAHKPLNASLRSFVGGLQGRSQALEALRNDWKYQIYNNMSMKYNNSEMSWKYRTFVPNMETKIETTNTGGNVLAYNSDELVGRLDFSFKGNVLSIDHTYAYKEGMGVGSLLVSAVNDYAVSKGLKVLPVCSFAVVWYQRHPQFQDILDRKD